MNETQSSSLNPNITPEIPENVKPIVEVNPLLARVNIPGSTFQLPSRGLFYHNNELSPDVQMGEVHIHAMSAYDEILMKTPDMLFSGKAVDIVFKRCIPQVLKPTELLAKDVDFLLVCLRQITYGEELEIKYNHNCKNSKLHSYIINTSTFIKNSKKIDPTTIGSAYTTKLDNGQIVKLRPSTFKNLMEMYHDIDPNKERTPEEELDISVTVIRGIIESVDEITDDDMIKDWIAQIPAGWINAITDVVENTSDFGPEFKVKTKCKDCGVEIEIESPINPVSFFL